MGEEMDSPTALLKAVHDVNQRQRATFMTKIDKQFGNGKPGAKLNGKKVAVWGIAFKPDTDDIREAPSITLMEYLLERGACRLSLSRGTFVDLAGDAPVGREPDEHRPPRPARLCQCGVAEGDRVEQARARLAGRCLGFG